MSQEQLARDMVMRYLVFLLVACLTLSSARAFSSGVANTSQVCILLDMHARGSNSLRSDCVASVQRWMNAGL